jgi:hypothetical protein
MEKTKKAQPVEKVVQKPVEVKKEIKKQYKDKVYELNLNNTPIVYVLKSRGLYWFDEELGYEREMKYCENQKTLFVPKEKQTLQKFLDLHPWNGTKFKEYNPVVIAENDMQYLEAEIQALNTAQSLDVDRLEAILRSEYGNKVSDMSSKEIKRDGLLFARQNPYLFLELANDENINIRNVGIKAVEANIIKLSNDQRTFMWGTNDRKLMTVPFDENPYSALAQYFKTDEGIEVYQTIEKKLK